MISNITTTLSYHHEFRMGVAMVNITPTPETNTTQSLCIYVLDYHRVSPNKNIPNWKARFQKYETLLFIGLLKFELVKSI